jgi:LPS-assembly protein
MLRLIVLLLLLAAGLRLRAAEAVSGLTGDNFDLNASVDGNLVYRGNAEFRGENLLLTADEIRFEQKSETVFATGHVVFTRAGSRLLADRIEYRRTDGWFKATRIRLGSPPYFAEGESAEGTRAEITIRQARLTYGEPGPWQPTLTADAITIAPGQAIRTEKAAAGIGRVLPFSIPRFQHEVARPFPASISLDGGFRRSLGAFVDAEVLAPLSPSVRLGGDLAIYSARGVMFGPAGRYESADDPARLRGAFRSGYINDHGDKKTDVLSRPIREDRAYAAWEHQQRLGENLTLNAQLNWWKDSDILRDFRPRAFFPVQEPDTSVESVYTGANYFVSAFARLQPNSFQQVQERLPEVRFDLLPYASSAGFYQNFTASFAVLRDDPPTGGAGLRSDRLDAYYAVSRPIAPREWFAFTPMMGGRLTHYANSGVGQRRTGNYLRLLGETGFDAVLRSSGTFDYKNPQWKIDGLRHLFTPRLSYRYVPQADKGRAQFPQIDRESFATYLPPLGLGGVRSIDDLHPTNTLRLGLDNVLQTRDPAQGSRDLLVFNLANDFRLKRRPGERTTSEIHAEVMALPASWLQFDLYQSFAPQSFTLREFNSGVTVRDGTVWSLRFSNNFLRHQIQDYAIDGRLRLSERFTALTRLHYDARKRRFNEQRYGVAHNVANTWLITYAVSVYSGRKRESNFGFDLRVDALRF